MTECNCLLHSAYANPEHHDFNCSLMRVARGQPPFKTLEERARELLEHIPDDWTEEDLERALLPRDC